jgi:NAD(P)-dependent dehydrogenase (short-subunit alcohol dehydrogenase family)
MSTARASRVADFTGRTALITGAASGIGAATALWLHAQGIAELVLVDRDEAGLAALELGCTAHRHVGDVGDPAFWARLEDDLPRLDHALINAGVADGGPLADLDFAEWRRILSINLDGAFLGLRTALRAMKRAGGGSIVLTSSAAGVKPVGMSGAYGTSKAGVIHLARVAAAEHLADGIRVNAIAPGRVDTPIWTKTEHFQQLEASLGSREAALGELGRQATGDAHGFSTAERIAGQIGFLLSDAADNITGTVLVSDGGYTL